MVDYYNSLSGDNLKFQDITDYYMEKFVNPVWQTDFYKLFLDTNFWKTVKIIDGAQEYVNQLIKDDFRVIFVTSTEPYNFYKKSKWLMRTFPNIDLRDSLISIKDKQLLSYLDILIDDYPKNLIDKKDNYGNLLKAKYKKILFDLDGQYMWTKTFGYDNEDSFRAFNWDDVYNIVT